MTTVCRWVAPAAGAMTPCSRVITDHLGSVRLVVNAGTGNVVQKLRYDTLGRVLEDANPVKGSA